MFILHVFYTFIFCSAQLSMSYMEKCYRYKIIIIIVIISCKFSISVLTVTVCSFVVHQLLNDLYRVSRQEKAKPSSPFILEGFQ